MSIYKYLSLRLQQLEKTVHALFFFPFFFLDRKWTIFDLETRNIFDILFCRRADVWEKIRIFGFWSKKISTTEFESSECCEKKNFGLQSRGKNFGLALTSVFGTGVKQRSCYSLIKSVTSGFGRAMEYPLLFFFISRRMCVDVRACEKEDGNQSCINIVFWLWTKKKDADLSRRAERSNCLLWFISEK